MLRWKPARLVIAAATLVSLGGCPICPPSEMNVVGGPDDGHVEAGDVIVLRATYGDWAVGPSHCGGDWAVNHVRGGSAEVGTIDACGTYTAPAVFPDGLALVVIEAADLNLANGCADCCPYATILLEPRP